MLPGHPSDFAARPEKDQADFFANVLVRARKAEAARGAIVRDFRIARYRVRLVFAGTALVEILTKALAHCRIDDATGPADLTLHIWDSESTGIDICPPPVEQHCFSDRGDIWTFHSARWKSAFLWSEYSINLLDLETSEGIFWIRSGAGLPFWTMASPFRSLLGWWLTARNAQLVHAAAVGTEHGGVLIVGKGGVGKSTSALACLAAGFRYAGDDYVILTEADGRPTAFTLYQTAKLDPAAAGRFARFAPRLIGGATRPGGEKAVMYLTDHLPGQVVEAVPLSAVLLPRFGGEEKTAIQPFPLTSVIGPAIYTTIAQLPHAGQRSVDLIERQLSSLPCFSLILGYDIDGVPRAIEALLEGSPEHTVPAVSDQPSPLISVVIPVYNGAHFLAEAVASVIAQNYPKLEIIVVDDGSTDAIEAAAAALPVEVRLLRKGNGGAADARNMGVRAASGDIVAFLDVDDLWPHGKLAGSLAHLFANPGTDVAIGGAQLLERDPATGIFEFVGSPAAGYIYYIGSAVFRRRAFERVGLFDAGLRFGEDTDWFARADAKGAVIDRIDATTLLVRRHDGNMTRGLSAPDLIPLKIVRNALDRKRGRVQAPARADPSQHG